MSSFDMDIQQISLHDSETSYTVGRRVQLQWWLYINWFHTVLRFQHPKDWRLVEATNDNNLCLQSLEGQEKVMTSRQGYEGKGRNYLVKSKNIRVYMEKKRNVQLQEGNASPRKQTPRVLRTRDANTQLAFRVSRKVSGLGDQGKRKLGSQVDKDRFRIRLGLGIRDQPSQDKSNQAFVARASTKKCKKRYLNFAEGIRRKRRTRRIGW